MYVNIFQVTWRETIGWDQQKVFIWIMRFVSSDIWYFHVKGVECCCVISFDLCFEFIRFCIHCTFRLCLFSFSIGADFVAGAHFLKVFIVVFFQRIYFLVLGIFCWCNLFIVLLDMKWQGLELLVKFFIKFCIFLCNAFFEFCILFDIATIKLASSFLIAAAKTVWFI